MPIRVVSKRTGGVKPLAHETVIDIDRGTSLGNPFVMKGEPDRAKVIADYELLLRKDCAANGPRRATLEAIAARVAAGETIALRCWCAPLACHGDVIKRAIERINAK